MTERELTARRLRERCLGLPGASEEFPFGDEVSVFKVGGKMFAACRLDGEPLQVTYRNRYGRRRSYATRFEGIVKNLERRYRETDSEWTREKIEEYMSLRPCPKCGCVDPDQALAGLANGGGPTPPRRGAGPTSQCSAS